MKKFNNKISGRTVDDNENNYCGYNHIYYVKAASKQHAIQMLDEIGIEVFGRKCTAYHDCSGQHFSGPIRIWNIKWSHSRKCYVVNHRWNIDI